MGENRQTAKIGHINLWITEDLSENFNCTTVIEMHFCKKCKEKEQCRNNDNKQCMRTQSNYMI